MYGVIANISAKGTRKVRVTVSDEEYSSLIHEFYQTYRPLQKRYSLRLHSHFDVYGNNFIEIWEYSGDIRGKRICMAKEEDEATCYKRAIEELKNYENDRKDRRNERKAG